ncbi:hypothetical protein BT63DRAFT_124630 [Microthyrium microscopicum]|uniref:Uncharacterized protein n=1 Tax=Microthyrium microscopicum TaxID=703497 RepID=A0A6A6TV49_9PEZI|nr:hypothetical protein BT63DRAFT_124630 [Microthyrium microscopicum]
MPCCNLPSIFQRDALSSYSQPAPTTSSRQPHSTPKRGYLPASMSSRNSRSPRFEATTSRSHAQDSEQTATQAKIQILSRMRDVQPTRASDLSPQDTTWPGMVVQSLDRAGQWSHMAKDKRNKHQETKPQCKDHVGNNTLAKRHCNAGWLQIAELFHNLAKAFSLMNKYMVTEEGRNARPGNMSQIREVNRSFDRLLSLSRTTEDDLRKSAGEELTRDEQVLLTKAVRSVNVDASRLLRNVVDLLPTEFVESAENDGGLAGFLDPILQGIVEGKESIKRFLGMA